MHTLMHVDVKTITISLRAHRLGGSRESEDLAEALQALPLTAREVLRAGGEASYLASHGVLWMSGTRWWGL
ncbi:MAG: hypothetical protein ABWK01_02175 [Infirmifilum sp.]